MEQTQLQESSTELQLVGFELGDEKFGVEILCVKEIIRVVSITRVPRAPEFVEGIINLRGDVIPVIDLRHRLGFAHQEFGKATRLIVVELDEQQVGFVVDSVSQVLRVPSDNIEPPPDMVAGVDSEYIQGIARADKENEEKLLMVLDLKRILSRVEQAEVRKVA